MLKDLIVERATTRIACIADPSMPLSTWTTFYDRIFGVDTATIPPAILAGTQQGAWNGAQVVPYIPPPPLPPLPIVPSVLHTAIQNAINDPLTSATIKAMLQAWILQVP